MNMAKYWENVRAYERKQRQEDLKQLRKQVYCTTYCNHGHYVYTGRPVGHQCRVIPPAALRAEMAGDYEEAIRLMAKTRGIADEYDYHIEEEDKDGH